MDPALTAAADQFFAVANTSLDRVLAAIRDDFANIPDPALLAVNSSFSTLPPNV